MFGAVVTACCTGLTLVVRAEAGCAAFEAIGWNENLASGAKSGLITGGSWRCSNTYAAGAGFVSDDYAVTVHTCFDEIFCSDRGFEVGAIYVQVNKDGIKGNFRARGQVLTTDRKSMKVKQVDSDVAYSWTDGEYNEFNTASLLIER